MSARRGSTAKQVMESLEDLQDLTPWARVPPCAHLHPHPHPAGLPVGSLSLGRSSSCLSLLWEPPAARVCGAERGGGVPRSPIPGHVARHTAAVPGPCWAALHMQGVVSPWEAGVKPPPGPVTSSLIPARCPSPSQGSSPPNHSMLAALMKSLCSSCHTLKKRRVSVIPALLVPVPLFPCSMCGAGYVPALCSQALGDQ